MREKKLKRAAETATPPETREEAERMLARLGEIQREKTLLSAALEETLAAERTRVEAQALRHDQADTGADKLGGQTGWHEGGSQARSLLRGSESNEGPPAGQGRPPSAVNQSGSRRGACRVRVLC